MRGPGTFTFSDGTKYMCQMKDAELNGLVTLIYSDHIYEGYLVDGKREGYGK